MATAAMGHHPSLHFHNDICFCFTNKSLASRSSLSSAMLNPCVHPFAAAGLLSVCVSLPLVCSLSLSLSRFSREQASERLPLRSSAHAQRASGEEGGVGILRGLGPRRIGRLLG
jgi:hypothetical protein